MNIVFSIIKIAAINILLSAAACNDSANTTETTSENMSNSFDSSANHAHELTPTASTVMNAEGNETVKSRQMPATDGAGGAPGSDAGMAMGSAMASTIGSTSAVVTGSKSK